MTTWERGAGTMYVPHPQHRLFRHQCICGRRFFTLGKYLRHYWKHQRGLRPQRAGD